MDLTPNLWCKFDNNLLDSSGNGNDLEKQTGNYTFSTDAYRGSYSIKSTFVDISTCVFLTSKNTYTIDNSNPNISVSLWFKITALNAQYDSLIYSPSNQNLVIQRISNTKLTFKFAGSDFFNGTGDFYNADNNWYHLVMIGEKIRNKSRIKYYINGVFKEQNTEYGTGTWTAYTEKLGVYSTYSGAQANIDDLRVYVGTVLSQAQITELYSGNPYYNFPTVLTRYNTDPIDTQYQFEVVDAEQKIISHYKSNALSKPFY
jgi:hypothetical protein